MGNIQGGEILLLIVLALFILGPERLPGYAAKLARGVRSLRDMAEGAKSQIKEEMGPAFDDVNWRQLDPRQYDPRRIVREALASPGEANAIADEPEDHGPVGAAMPPARMTGLGPVRYYDPAVATPFDPEAT